MDLSVLRIRRSSITRERINKLKIVASFFLMSRSFWLIKWVRKRKGKKMISQWKETFSVNIWRILELGQIRDLRDQLRDHHRLLRPVRQSRRKKCVWEREREKGKEKTYFFGNFARFFTIGVNEFWKSFQCTFTLIIDHFIRIFWK